MINDVNNDYILLRKKLVNIKNKTNDLIVTYDYFLKKIKVISCVDNNLINYIELTDVLNVLKKTILNLEIILSSINEKI